MWRITSTNGDGGLMQATLEAVDRWQSLRRILCHGRSTGGSFGGKKNFCMQLLMAVNEMGTGTARGIGQPQQPIICQSFAAGWCAGRG